MQLLGRRFPPLRVGGAGGKPKDLNVSGMTLDSEESGEGLDADEEGYSPIGRRNIGSRTNSMISNGSRHNNGSSGKYASSPSATPIGVVETFSGEY